MSKNQIKTQQIKCRFRKTSKNNAFFNKFNGADLLWPLVGRPQNPRVKPGKQWIWLDLRKRSISEPEITCFERKTCENMQILNKETAPPPIYMSFT